MYRFIYVCGIRKMEFKNRLILRLPSCRWRSLTAPHPLTSNPFVIVSFVSVSVIQILFGTAYCHKSAISVLLMLLSVTSGWYFTKAAPYQ